MEMHPVESKKVIVIMAVEQWAERVVDVSETDMQPILMNKSLHV